MASLFVFVLFEILVFLFMLFLVVAEADIDNVAVIFRRVYGYKLLSLSERKQ